MFGFISISVTLIVVLYAEKVRYISTEHPAITYLNQKYVTYINFTSKRYGRSDPFYYISVNAHSISTIGNNVTVNFYFYEYLSNRYKRGFVEMHFRFCDMIEKDQFFGSTLRQRLSQSCPYGPGDYHAHNMTIPIKQVPHNFPFRKGRIYCNITSTATDELLASAHIDMEIKEIHIRKKPTN